MTDPSPRRRALVTGGNRGIGLAIVRALLGEGCTVYLGSRDRAAGEAAAKGAGAVAVELDVADPASIRAALAETGPLDILINNAGVLNSGHVLDDPQDLEDCMAVMLRGPYLLMHHVLPQMRAAGYGRVVNVSSDWGSFSQGLGGPGAYGVAKAALNALTFAAARGQPANIKINAMCPGWVQTRMGGAGATRSPAEAADTAVWLATLGPGGPTGGFFRDRKPLDW